MNKQEAEKVITEYVKPIFGFALKRCKSEQDAEDLAQEIVLKAFRSLLIKDDVQDMGKFIWTIAHNALSNYYRSLGRVKVGPSIEEVAEILADPKNVFEEEEDKETLGRLQKEIAYLSKLQRRIVIAYYFENRKQAEIADELKVPVGTVKWHLFEAKKELKRGMEKMREASELKFNPIKFEDWGFAGSLGSKSPDEFLRSAIAQNICYMVRKEAKTIHEIADALGVSPVFVEGEVEFLAEYGLLLQQKDKYIANFIIEEVMEELLVLQENMYEQAAEWFANDLYDELIESGLLEDEGIECGQEDTNFLLWSLIPYITAWSGEKLGRKISFEEVVTIRPDGAENIYYASVRPRNLIVPDNYKDMKDWFGPMWNGNERQMVWQLDTEWSAREKPLERNVPEEHGRVMNLYDYEQKHALSQADYVWLAERGYIKITGNYGQNFKASWQIVILKNAKIRKKLIALGEKLQEKYRDKFCKLLAPYAEMKLATTPVHLQKICRHTLQYTFDCDGKFLLHCYHVLLRNGKLKVPAEEQRKSLCTMLCLK
ncbi:MAG: RNA polymerase sigma factor [Lachnospiraceae bacterium]|nr:RNA polymerase sigma factor [Lachnospiraceae bacterium]